MTPLLIGLTGPIGCGKSTVARMLAELGGEIIDADVLARQATAPGSPTLPDIRARFGSDLFDAVGELDRAALAAIVFEDDEALADLEAIVHPEVRRRVDTAVEHAANERLPFIVIEAIKLVEGGLAARCDEVWLIECAAENQLERLADRGLSGADAARRIDAQGKDMLERLAAQLGERPGIRRLHTDDPLEEIRERVEDLLADALEPLLDD